jgi:hypothetical protein
MFPQQDICGCLQMVCHALNGLSGVSVERGLGDFAVLMIQIAIKLCQRNQQAVVALGLIE